MQSNLYVRITEIQKCIIIVLHDLHANKSTTFFRKKCGKEENSHVVYREFIQLKLFHFLKHKKIKEIPMFLAVFGFLVGMERGDQQIVL